MSKTWKFFLFSFKILSQWSPVETKFLLKLCLSKETEWFLITRLNELPGECLTFGKSHLSNGVREGGGRAGQMARARRNVLIVFKEAYRLSSEYKWLDVYNNAFLHFFLLTGKNCTYLVVIFGILGLSLSVILSFTSFLKHWGWLHCLPGKWYASLGL